jgi:hypothetical protein
MMERCEGRVVTLLQHFIEMYFKNEGMWRDPNCLSDMFAVSLIV